MSYVLEMLIQEIDIYKNKNNLLINGLNVINYKPGTGLINRFILIFCQPEHFNNIIFNIYSVNDGVSFKNQVPNVLVIKIY